MFFTLPGFYIVWLEPECSSVVKRPTPCELYVHEIHSANTSIYMCIRGLENYWFSVFFIIQTFFNHILYSETNS